MVERISEAEQARRERERIARLIEEADERRRKSRVGKKTYVRDEFAYDIGKVIRDVLERLFSRSDVLASCLTCQYWDERTELCDKFKARPPAHIIVNACPDYFDNNEIPF